MPMATKSLILVVRSFPSAKKQSIGIYSPERARVDVYAVSPGRSNSAPSLACSKRVETCSAVGHGEALSWCRKGCAYSAEDDRLFRRNVTGCSAESALAGFSTLVGTIGQDLVGCEVVTGIAHSSTRALFLVLSVAASRLRIDSLASRWMRCER
jgi:hypothetical protein